MRAPFVGVVADDLTGAGDIGSMFAKQGYAVRIFSSETDLDGLPERLAGRRTDVVILDSDSRMAPPAVAYERVRRATAALRRAGCALFYKKTCSVFRGNVGPEFDAMLDELDESFGLAVAAFPKNGRQTCCGEHFVHGRPLADSEFARDPVHPMTESNLVTLLQRQTERRVGLIPLAAVRQGPEALRRAMAAARAEGVSYGLCDAQTQADLASIAEAAARERVLLGSSALCEELPALWERMPPFDPLAGLELRESSGVLVIAGSVMPQTQAQVTALAEAGALLLTLANEEALLDPKGAVARLADQAAAALRAGRHTVVRSANWPEAVAAAHAMGAAMGLDRVAVSRRISTLLAQVAAQALTASGARRLVTLGGDTSAALCRELGIDETVVVAEIAPGLPSSLAPGDRPLLLVLKSGSFGGPTFGLEAIRHLQRLGGQS